MGPRPIGPEYLSESLQPVEIWGNYIFVKIIVKGLPRTYLKEAADSQPVS
jgi:hypothetical protein